MGHARPRPQEYWRSRKLLYLEHSDFARCQVFLGLPIQMVLILSIKSTVFPLITMNKTTVNIFGKLIKLTETFMVKSIIHFWMFSIRLSFYSQIFPFLEVATKQNYSNSKSSRTEQPSVSSESLLGQVDQFYLKSLAGWQCSNWWLITL